MEAMIVTWTYLHVHGCFKSPSPRATQISAPADSSAGATVNFTKAAGMWPLYHFFNA